MLTKTQYKKPAVGSIVRVVTRYKEHYYYATNEWRDTEYVGRVVADKPWQAPGSFELHTKNKEFPVSTITLSSVIELESMDGKKVATEQIPAAPETWVVKGSRGDQYTVTRTDSKYTCTCPGFVFRRNCKHIKEITEKNK